MEENYVEEMIRECIVIYNFSHYIGHPLLPHDADDLLGLVLKYR